jgi:two-component system nitrate/nitrite sensor histidine kinase NarX
MAKRAFLDEPRHGPWQRARLLPLLAVAAAALLLAMLLVLVQWRQGGGLPWLLPAVVTLILVGMLACATALIRLHRRLLHPLADLERAVGRVCQGVPEARLSVQRAADLGGLVGDVQSLGEELNDLYEDMDNRVARQTRRLAQKTASVKILYEVAASVNHADDLAQLLIRYLGILKDMINGRAATVRLRDTGGRLRLVGSVTPDGNTLLEHEMLPVPLCRCGRALVPGEILCNHDPRECSRRNGRPMFGPDEIDAVEVPLHYHDENLGCYRIYVERPGIGEREDVLELLTTIGSHLGMAIAKQRSDAEARRLSIIEERTHLAHELHDSLAQTLVGLRFQVRMLQETLGQDLRNAAAREEASRIRNALDEANTELRELLTSFRAPLDQRGLVPALDQLAAQFRQETGLSTFFQQDCRQLQLNTQEEMQMLRIAQEALANIRKHAKAHTVRILLRCRGPGTYVLLVEDDGVGFERGPLGGRPGEHIGLSIMEERARRFGADLRIESEPGEGTRVELVFTPGEKLRASNAGEAI